MLEKVNYWVSKVGLKSGRKTLVLFNVPDEDVKEFDGMHHVMLLDTSGSMWPHVDKLMDDVKVTLDMMDENDYLTIIRFSGAGQFRTILKGVKVSDKENIKKILDTMKNAGGCTCFSDPIKELNSVIEETAPMCSIYNVTIFTDGDTVTPWPVQEEIRRIFENLAEVHDKIVALNAIGYGEYYNRKLLLDMVGTTDYGEFAHADDIEDFHKIFSRQKDAVLNLRGKRCTLEAYGNDNEAAEIIGLTTKTVKYGKGKLSTRLAEKRNTFAVLVSGANILIKDSEVSHIVGDIGKEVYELKENGLGEEMVEALYAFAYKAFEQGNRDLSMEIFDYLGDQTNVDQQVNAFTNSEVGAELQCLRSAVFNKELRHTWEKESNTCMPDVNAYCVLDLLKDLVASEAMYVPTENYERVRRKRTDTFNLFVRDEEFNLAEMTDVVVGQERMNMSIKFRMPGHVKLNPKRAKSVGLPETVPACIYRTHAIIKDGHPNMEILEVVLKKDVFEKNFLWTAKIENFGCDCDCIDGDCMRMKIHLDSLPVINAFYKKNATAEYLWDNECMMLEIEAQNKIINACATEEAKFSAKGETEYTPEQIAVLIEHGMRTPGVYSAISTEQEEPDDYIVIREFKTQIKGFSSLPPIEKAVNKSRDNKKLTPSEALVLKYWEALGKEDPKKLLELKKKNDQLLKNIRFNLAGIKIATVLTGSNIPGLTQQQDGSWTFEKDGKILVAKMNRKEIAI